MHRGKLRLLEDSLSKLVLYAPGRFVITSEYDENFRRGNPSPKKMLPETLYAIVNVWSLMNDTLYYGFGKGNGLSVGNIDDFDCCGQRNLNRNILTILRSTLSVLDCIYPALEVSAYYASGKHTESRNINALEVATTFERIKFTCRLGILILNYLMQYNICDGMDDMIKGLGILENGASFEPEREQHTNYIKSSKEERNRVEKLLYSGPRTGKKSKRLDPFTRSKTSQLQRHSILNAPLMKLMMLIIGEVLHIYRPMYYIHSSLKQEKLSQFKNKGVSKIKLWVLSFCMDLVSYKLIKASKAVNIGNSDGSTSTFNILSESSKEELYRRKVRWVLYILRPPIWEVLTKPAFMYISGIFQHAPFIGEPLVNYCLDMMEYCKKWHFMMER